MTDLWLSGVFFGWGFTQDPAGGAYNAPPPQTLPPRRLLGCQAPNTNSWLCLCSWLDFFWSIRVTFASCSSYNVRDSIY